MQVSFDFTRADWLATLPASYSRLFRVPSLRRSILIGLFVLVVVTVLSALGAIVYAVKFRGFTLMPKDITLVVGILIFGPMVGATFGTVVPLTVLYFFSGFPHRFTVALFPDKLTRKGLKMDMQIPWQDVAAISDQPKQIFFFFKSPKLITPQGRSFLRAVMVPFIVIPKRIFADEAATEAFRKEAERLWMNAKMGLTNGETPEGVWPPAPRQGN